MTMNESRQTLETIQTDFDRIALVEGEGWNHNARYHDYLLGHIPEPCRRILEIGCGGGQFSRLLAERGERVLAIDLSPEMLRLARARSASYPNIDFVQGDVMACRLPDEEFDFIATLTTMHHLPMESMLKKTARALKPGGVFVCLDLYRRSGPSDLLFDAAAYAVAPFARLIQTGKLRPPRAVRKAYAEHGKTDTYLTLPEIEQICERVLPGAVVKRHLFWRYSIVWKKAAGGQT